jgi:hypothetical protein
MSVSQPGGTPGDTVTATVSVNDATVGSGNVYVPPGGTRATNYIAKSYWDEPYFHGDIATILVYDRELTPAEHDAVTANLAQQYGIPLG